MSVPHSILEIRTGRDSEHTPEAIAHLFGSLPYLHSHLGHQLLGSHEHLSFEIALTNQVVLFQIYTPDRLCEYIKSLVVASYPEALITNQSVTDDIAARLANTATTQGNLCKAAWLKLKHTQALPLRSFQDLKEVDSLSPLLSALSASQPEDQVLIQFVIEPDKERWKNSVARLLESQPTHPQRALMEKKMASRSLKVGIKIAVSSHHSERSELWLETITSAYQAMSQSDGNVLVVSRPILKQKFWTSLQDRSLTFTPTQHLSLEELATLFHFPNSKLTHLPNLAWGKTLFSQPPENLPIVTRQTDPEIKKNINVFAQTVYKNTLTTYGLKRADRRRHMYVIGKTGTGKSTLLANMAINDLKNDEGLCVIDPHGDLVETILNYIPSRRINDVVYFDPSDPERTVKINLFEGENVAHRELIASGIVSIFQKLYAYSWGPRLEYILRNALLTLLKSEQARLSDILDLLTNPKFRDKIVENLDDPILKNFWLYEFDKLQDRQRTEAIAPILNKVGQFVSSPLVRDVVNAHHSSFSIEEIMSQGKILLVNLSQGKLGEDNATLLGAMMITKIQLSAMARVHQPEEERKDFYLYVDEFQNFATQSFNKILSEARKYRLNLTLANQYIAQIPEDVQKAIFGNCGTIASFVMGADDANVFSKEFAGKYTTEDLVTLGKYQIINKVSIDNVISLPFTGTTLALAKSSNLNRDKVIRVSRERYATKKK